MHSDWQYGMVHACLYEAVQCGCCMPIGHQSNIIHMHASRIATCHQYCKFGLHCWSARWILFASLRSAFGLQACWSMLSTIGSWNAWTIATINAWSFLFHLGSTSLPLRCHLGSTSEPPQCYSQANIGEHEWTYKNKNTKVWKMNFLVAFVVSGVSKVVENSSDEDCRLLSIPCELPRCVYVLKVLICRF